MKLFVSVCYRSGKTTRKKSILPPLFKTSLSLFSSWTYFAKIGMSKETLVDQASYQEVSAKYFSFTFCRLSDCFPCPTAIVCSVCLFGMAVSALEAGHRIRL